jgi:hypothetical protein
MEYMLPITPSPLSNRHTMKKKYSFLLFLLTISFGSKSQCVSADFYALKDFYTAFNGDNWANNTGWSYIKGNASPPAGCTFNNIYGVSNGTNGNGNYVRSIKLSSNLLAGTMASSIGNFSSLDTLKLDLNQITGAIPVTVGNLSNLKYLNIDGESATTRQFSGVIPSSIRNLKMLKFISANYTGFNTPFPSDLAFIPNIEEVYFSNAGLTGTISHAMGFQTHLRRFDFSDNNLSGCFPKSIKSWCLIENKKFPFVNNPSLGDWDGYCYSNTDECPCVSNINLVSTSNDISYGVQLVQSAATNSTFNAANKLTGGSFTIYEGSGSIVLEPGFSAEQGTVFMTTLGGGCN